MTSFPAGLVVLVCLFCQSLSFSPLMHRVRPSDRFKNMLLMVDPENNNIGENNNNTALSPKCYVILSNIQSGSNVGSICRNALAFNVDEVIVVGRRNFRDKMRQADRGAKIRQTFVHFNSIAEAHTYLKVGTTYIIITPSQQFLTLTYPLYLIPYPSDRKTCNNCRYRNSWHCRVSHHPTLHHLHCLYVRQRRWWIVSTSTRSMRSLCVHTTVCSIRWHGVYQCSMCQCRGPTGHWYDDMIRYHATHVCLLSLSILYPCPFCHCCLLYN